MVREGGCGEILNGEGCWKLEVVEMGEIVEE